MMAARSEPFAPLVRALARPGGASSDYDLNPGLLLPAGRTLRPAAVLMAFRQGADGIEVVLTKRASHLRHHPGQIAFPGGKVDPSDPDATAAALREANEEIGLDPALVLVLGVLPLHETVTGFSVLPVLGWISAGFTARAEPGEVDEVFSVPLALLADHSNYRVERRHWLGQDRQYYAVPYGPYYIWGATARILYGFAHMMQP